MIGQSSMKQSFKRKVGMESRGHCSLSEAKMSLWISVWVAGMKLISFGGEAGGKRNGSGESDGKNLVRMRLILSLKKSRNVLARDDASGDPGSEFEGFRWRIVFRVFQSVRGLADDSVTRLNKNEDLALEMRDLTELHWARNFLRSKGNFQRRQHRSSRLRYSRLAWRISGLIHGVWVLWTTVSDLIGTSMSRMNLRVEENWSARSEALEALLGIRFV